MKWFTAPTEEDRSHERIMAILDSIDEVELFGTAAANEPTHASANNPLTANQARE